MLSQLWDLWIGIRAAENLSKHDLKIYKTERPNNNFEFFYASLSMSFCFHDTKLGNLNNFV